MLNYKKSISNIAWRHNQLDLVLEIISKENFNFIEVAPLELYDSWANLNVKKSKSVLKKLGEKNIGICSMQSVFYGTKLNLFENYSECIAHMETIQRICKEISCEYIVFGAPKVRNRPQNLTNLDALEILDNFLFQFKDIKIGIEAVPEYYGTNILNNYDQVNDFVQQSNNDNLKIHYDVGAANSTNFSINESFQKDLVSNVHLSLKGLEPLTGKEKFISQLQEDGLLKDRFVSIEMRKTSLSQLKKSITVFGESP